MGIEKQGENDYVLVNEEPNHKERWKNDLVRVYVVEIPPFGSCLRHKHIRNTIYTCIEELDVEEIPFGKEKIDLHIKKGELLWRDHRIHPLVHSAKAKAKPIQIVAVEIQDQGIRLANDKIPFHEHPGIQLLEKTPDFRAYRLTLVRKAPEIVLHIPTDAVLLSLQECHVQLSNSHVEDIVQSDHTRNIKDTKYIGKGEDIKIVPGRFSIQMTSSSSKQTSILQFTLIEIF